MIWFKPSRDKTALQNGTYFLYILFIGLVDPELDRSGYGFVLGWYWNVMKQMFQGTVHSLMQFYFGSVEGSLTRDFRLQVLFVNHCPPGL